MDSTMNKGSTEFGIQRKMQSYRKFIVQIKASCDLCVPIFLAPYYARQIGQNIAELPPPNSAVTIFFWLEFQP